MTSIVIGSLASLALMVSVLGCGSEPPTVTPTRVPTATPTPAPAATPHVGGTRPVYDVATRSWNTVTPTPVPSTPTPAVVGGRRHIYDEDATARQSRRTPSPTLTATLTPTPTPIPDYYPVSDENERMKAFLADFESLTDENASIAFRIANPYGSNELELPNGDMLVLGKEVAWVAIGQKHHFIASLLHRCFDGVEYPPIRAQLEVRQRHVGWDRLEFIRDASIWDYNYVAVQFGEGGFEVKSLYRVGDDKWVLAQAGFNPKTCQKDDEVSGFGFTELVKNTRGYLADAHNEPRYDCYSAWKATDEPELCPYGRLGSEMKRSEMLDPITNAEIESGRIRCRGKDC